MNSSPGRFAPIVNRLLCVLGLTLLLSCMNPAGETADQSKNTEETPIPTVLIISEYVEGDSYNRALEISNIGDATADLSEYFVEIYEDGTTYLSRTIQLNPSDTEAGQPGSGRVLCPGQLKSE
ncbi:MAG: hypothetical protein P1P77_00275 [Spirochaetaceae bacterium]|nr:hypothetical protein [Spirochaetaceae bacterium]